MGGRLGFFRRKEHKIQDQQPRRNEDEEEGLSLLPDPDPQPLRMDPEEEEQHLLLPDRPALTEEPWRETKGWSREVRDNLKDDIARRLPKKINGKVNVENLMIALTGEIGAGKSSYLNSINSIFQEEVAGATADVGRKATSLTKEYRVYSITPKDEDQPLRWRICDTMGLQANKENDTANILKAVNGHVPDKFKFSDREINENTPDYIVHPELKDKAHCVAIVVNAQKLNLIKAEIKQKIKTLRNKLQACRTYILLTHIDMACIEVSKDVTKVYHSTAIEMLVQKVSNILDGLPKNQIFPVMNYDEKLHLEDAMDILLLYPLRQMLSNAQEYIKIEMQKQPRPIGPASSRSQQGHPVRHPASSDSHLTS